MAPESRLETIVIFRNIQCEWGGSMRDNVSGTALVLCGPNIMTRTLRYNRNTVGRPHRRLKLYFPSPWGLGGLSGI